jgi:CRISPR/Cas system CMR-associated protein Cmr3 (group 5 of RAMP superfamily)
VVLLASVIELIDMKITEDQIISFQKLYKKELGIGITTVEAQEKALSLLRYLAISVIPIDDEPVSP